MADFLHGRGCTQANFSQFLRRENAEMAAFLRRCLEVGDRGRTIEQIRDGKAKPSQQLADAVERMLNGNTEFVTSPQRLGHHDRALGLPGPLEPQQGQQPLDHDAGHGGGGGLHPHLPRPGVGDHRRHHRAGSGRP